MSEAPAPFSTYRAEVPREWLDYNDHMHDASYGIAFSDANEEIFAALDLSADYRTVSGAAYYTVQSHIRFVNECRLGDVLTASTIMVSADPKRIRLYTELKRDDGKTVATGEYLYLHVDTTRGTTSPLDDDRYARVQQLVTDHASLPRPDHLGLGIGAPPPDAGDA